MQPLNPLTARGTHPLLRQIRAHLAHIILTRDSHPAQVWQRHKTTRRTQQPGCSSAPKNAPARARPPRSTDPSVAPHTRRTGLAALDTRRRAKKHASLVSRAPAAGGAVQSIPAPGSQPSCRRVDDRPTPTDAPAARLQNGRRAMDDGEPR